MHPFIVRDNRKEKCPICHMDLAKRKKGVGEAEPLPAFLADEEDEGAADPEEPQPHVIAAE